MVAEGLQNDWRESESVLDARIDTFAAWLLARPERRIALVGHGDFWQAFTRRVYGRGVRLANCAWVAFEGPLGARAVLTHGPALG